MGTFKRAATVFEFMGFEDGVEDRLIKNINEFVVSDNSLRYSVAKAAVLCPLSPQPDGRFAGGVFSQEGPPIPEAQTRRGDLGVVVGLELETNISLENAQTIPIGIYGGPAFGAYGHIILESLARLWCCVEIEDIPILFVVHDKKPVLPPVLIACCNLMNIDISRLKPVYRPTICKQLIIPQPGIELGLSAHAEYFKHLQNSISSSRFARLRSGNSGKGVYLSRSKLSRRQRRAFGEDGLEALLVGSGEDVVWPEQLSVESQVEIANVYDRYAGYIGSQFHTLIFRDPRADFDAVYLCNEYPNRNFMQIDIMFSGHRVYGISSDYAEPLFNFGLRAPFRVDFESAIACMQKIGVPVTPRDGYSALYKEDLSLFLYTWFYNFFFYKLMRPYQLSSASGNVVTARQNLEKRIVALTALVGALQRNDDFRLLVGMQIVQAYYDAAQVDRFGETEAYKTTLAEILVRAG